jgi:transglutaminase-like putative cysteine protease
MHSARAFAAFAFAVAFALVGALPAAALAEGAFGEALQPSRKVIVETWFVEKLNNERVGWVHEMEEELEGGILRSSSDSFTEFGRQGVRMSTRSRTFVEEDASGHPLRMGLLLDTSNSPVETVWTWKDGGVEEVQHQEDRVQRAFREAPPAGVMAPAAFRRFLVGELARGATEIKVEILSPEMGLEASTYRGSYKRRMLLDDREGRIPVQIWEVQMDHMPVPITELLDERGVALSQRITLGLGILDVRDASRDEALAPVRGAALVNLDATIAIPVADVPDASEVTHARLRFQARERLLPNLPTAGAQVVESTRRRKRIASLDEDVNRSSPVTQVEALDPSFLEPSGWVDAADPLIASLAEEALRGAPIATLDRAEALRAYAHAYMGSWENDVGFATASEVARSRRGDCTEHALFLMGLLRAAGIPARLATGLVYTTDSTRHEPIFGWHAWTQAQVDGRWVDLDATLPHRFHALHILIGTSSLAHGPMLDADDEALAQLGAASVTVVVLSRANPPPPSSSRGTTPEPPPIPGR